jgi:iron complex outermembrane receptor protein
VPDDRTLKITNVFVQDTISLAKHLKLTLGVKLENYTYSEWEVQPDVRLAWQVTDAHMLWAAASRAIRAPTPFDHDVVERVGGQDFLLGNPNFKPETVNTYEIGYRGEPLNRFSVSLSVFLNDYDDLRTIEPAPATFVPLRWDNEMHGHTYGVTGWAKWQLADWWRVSPGFTVLRKRLKFDNDASRLLGLDQAGNDPSTHVVITSSMDLPANVIFENTLRYVAARPNPYLPHYYELGSRLAWRLSSGLEVSLTGFNLLHDRHVEYPAPNGEEIRRSVIAELRWRFE